VALVSDAGTPLISDPGYKLVREACAAGHAVTALPARRRSERADAVGAADRPLLLRGISPAKQGARRQRIAELARIPATLVLFESGNRVRQTLADLTLAMAGREAAICRELTKLHEEVRRAPLEALAQAAGELETRGEFVLVVGPPPADTETMASDAFDAALADALRRGSVRDAVAYAVEISGRPRREVYARALELIQARGDDGDGDDATDPKPPSRGATSRSAVRREPRRRLPDRQAIAF